MLIIAGLFSLLTSFSELVQATEMPFTVKTIVPDNQIDKRKTFFNLQVKPSQQQIITANLTNTTSQDVTIKVNVNSAKTNANGVIEYGETNIRADKSLEYAIPDLVKYPSEVKISANSSKEVLFHITMPKKKYNGIILGGIVFQQKESRISPSVKGTSIQNHYAYAVALSLKESDNQVSPNLNLLKVSPGQNNARNVISAQIQNDKSILLSKVKVSAKVYAKGAKTPVYTSVTTDMQIAPNSNFKYPISLNGTEMKPGNYTLKMSVTGTAYVTPKTWYFTKNFKIKSAEASSLNKSDVDIKANTNNNNLIFILVGLLLLLIVTILIIIIIRQNKKLKK
ncbi:DUF916 and DUF3324 domain-containing protein [Leuconostoc litchii]|uniref:DUF916 and DUF3324 domain-containing protein n=1 Tax=Leuconostoc litchii TaxID=1981069 RepID=UPI001FCB1AEF|nr:DUF916 and DUF3324 domain-containing protein [Leuconostoc litchii]